MVCYLPNSQKYFVLNDMYFTKQNEKPITLPNSIIAFSMECCNREFILPFKTKFLLNNYQLFDKKNKNLKYFYGNNFYDFEYKNNLPKLDIVNIVADNNTYRDDHNDNNSLTKLLLCDTLIIDNY